MESRRRGPGRVISLSKNGPGGIRRGKRKNLDKKTTSQIVKSIYTNLGKLMENKNKKFGIIAGISLAAVALCVLVISIGFGGYYLYQSARQTINSPIALPKTQEIKTELEPVVGNDGVTSGEDLPPESKPLDIAEDLNRTFETFWTARDLLHDNYLEQPIDDLILANGAIQGLETFLEENNLSTSGLDLPKDAPTAEEISSAAGTPEEIVSTFLPFWEVWNKLAYIELPETTSTTSLMRHALTGMVESLEDPYTNYFDPDLAERWNTDLSGEYEGIGAWVDVDGEYLTIISPIEGTPAEEAGLQPGDQIIAIDGDDMTGVDPNIALKRVVGPAGTKVILTILRETSNEPFDVGIIRRKISIPYIESEMLENNIAYIRLIRFYDGGDLDLRNALENLLKQNPKGLIFDLRGNPGGYLTTVANITSDFISEGDVLIEEFSDNSQKKYPIRNSQGIATDIPLVVLIDQGSASASEIFAGAVKDYKRGILVGQTTFGKGLVQLPITLPDEQGVLSITIARWLTPLGTTIHEIGIQPDYSIEITENDIELGLDPQLEKAIELLTNAQ